MKNSYDYAFIDSMENIVDLFISSVERVPNNNALWVGKSYYSYAAMYKKLIPVTHWLSDFKADRVLIFSQRTLSAYTAILSSLLVGKAYVPLNPSMPASRNNTMIELADSNLFIVDAIMLEQLKDILKLHKNTEFNILVLNGNNEIPAWIKEYPMCTFFFEHLMGEKKDKGIASPKKDIDADACLLFTSGSTGTPKGVMLSHRNIFAYLRHTVERYKLTENDRVSQITELTFDFSVQDMFISWAVGACVYAFPENYFIGMMKYLNDNKISFMTTVPSTARLLHQLGKLNKNSLPFLRQNIFGGEPFSDSIAEIWQEAALNTLIDNVCGPTEATVAYLSYTWHKDQVSHGTGRSCIPLGRPFQGQEILIVDQNMEIVRKGELGELLLSGSQVITSYWRNKSLTEEKFLVRTNKNNELKRWYRTGDMVLWDEDDGVIFKGRIDDQIQIRGCRVEKLEVEKVIRAVAKTEFAAVLPWPIALDGTVEGVIAFVSDSPCKREDIIRKSREYLPDYMVPKEVYTLEKIPLNFNGKTDYLELKRIRQKIGFKE